VSTKRGMGMSLKEYILKTTVIGEPEISYKLSCAFTEHKFNQASYDYAMVLGVEIFTKKIRIDKAQIKVILTTIIHEECSKITSSYFRGASTGIFIFDKMSLESFHIARDYYHKFRKQIPDPQIPVALVGIINDKEEVTTDVSKSFAELKGMNYYEMTKKDGVTFKDIIYQLTKEALETKKN
jgi:hypothetical protein